MLEECKHMFCADCFKEYYRSLIEDQNRHQALKCPQWGCDTKPTEEEIQQIINENCYRKFKRFQLNTMVAQDKDLMFCTSPNCENVLDKRKAVKSIVTCSECGGRSCVKCKMRAHWPMSCEKNMQSKYNMGVRGVKIHRCPRCGSQVEKEGGCPMMSCAICHHGWCWSCGFPDDHWFHEMFEGGC